MTFALTWMPKALRDAGLNVEEQPGWQTRGHGDMGVVRGVLCHHTAGKKDGNMPSLGIVINGRPDLAGPLCNLALGRDGTFFIVAAGRAYHAGRGLWQGVSNGNSSLIGIEAENTGLPNDQPWPEVQMDAYAKGCAALLKHIGAKPIMCAGHAEYALPKGRKSDPSFAMPTFREKVATFMGATVQPHPADRVKVDGVAPDTLNLRDSPNGAIVGVLNEDQVVELVATKDKWQQVKTAAGQVGWAAKRFLVPV